MYEGMCLCLRARDHNKIIILFNKVRKIFNPKKNQTNEWQVVNAIAKKPVKSVGLLSVMFVWPQHMPSCSIIMNCCCPLGLLVLG